MNKCNVCNSQDQFNVLRKKNNKPKSLPPPPKSKNLDLVFGKTKLLFECFKGFS